MNRTNRNMWCQVNYDGYNLEYKVNTFWKPLFKFIGLNIHCNIPVNVILAYTEKRRLFTSSILLFTYNHKINGQLNPTQLPRIWGISPKLCKSLIERIETVIEQNKAGTNVALICVDRGLVEDYYKCDGKQLPKNAQKQYGLKMASQNTYRKVLKGVYQSDRITDKRKLSGDAWHR